MLAYFAAYVLKPLMPNVWALVITDRAVTFIVCRCRVVKYSSRFSEEKGLFRNYSNLQVSNCSNLRNKLINDIYYNL